MKNIVRTCLLIVVLSAPAAGEVPSDNRREALYVNVFDHPDEALAGLRKLAEAQDWGQAVAQAQKLIVQGEKKLFEIEPRIYVPFAEKVRRQVLSWPEPGRRAYRARYDAAANALCRAGVEARSIRDLQEVVRLYSPSSGAVRALVALAEIRAQRGELRAARRTIQRARKLAPEKSFDAKLHAFRRTWDAAASRRATQARTFEIGLRRWSFDIPEADVDPRVAAGLRANGLRVPRVVHPVVSGDRVFLQTTQWLAALKRATGELLWRYPRQPMPPTSRYCADAFLRPAVGHGRVFAVVAGQVVALSAASGTELWRAPNLSAARQEDRNKQLSSPRLLVASPALGDGMVFVCAAALKQETEWVAVALDARTGGLLWRLKPCSQVFRGYLGRGSFPAPPAFAQGTVYVTTNLGAVAAIAAETGEVRWLARYSSFEPARRRMALRNDDCWRNGPPIVCGGLVIAAPQDSDDLVAFDAASGRQQWRHPRSEMRYLIGAAQGRVYISGDRAAAIDVETGKVVWFSAESWKPAGRPTLTGPALLVPTQKALVTLDANTGRQLSQYRLDTPRQRGNIVVAGDTLLLTSFARVDAYGAAAHIPEGERFRSGQRLERIGDVAGALRLYKLALESLDEDAALNAGAPRERITAAISAARLRLGRKLMAAERYAEAERSFLLARRYAPSSTEAAEATFAIAECREQQGRWEQAIEAYQFVIRRQRGSSVELGGIRVPAEVAAQSRIDRLIRRQGRQVYRAQESEAAELLQAAQTKNRPGLFEAVIANYPNSTHAAEARKVLLKLPDRSEGKGLTLVWRTPFDPARASPVVISTSEDSSGSGEPFVLIATRDKGDRRTSLWSAVERRRVADGRLDWRTQVGRCLAKAQRVVGMVVLRSGSRLIALDVRTGRVAWTTGQPQAKQTTVFLRVARERIVDSAVGGGTVFAATAAAEVYALDAKTGRERWRKKLNEPVVVGSMHFTGGKLVLCGENPGTIYWFDPASGKQAESVRLDRKDNRLTDTPAVQPHSRRLCLVLGDRQVRICRLDSGRTLWKTEMPFSVGRIATTSDEECLLVFPDRWSFGGEVPCFEALTGKRLWRQKPVSTNPDNVYVGSNLIVSIHKELRADVMVARSASDRKDGATAWKSILPVEPVIDDVVGAGEFLIGTGSRLDIGGRSGCAVVVRKKDGRMVASLARPGARYLSVSAVGGTLLFCSSRGIDAYRMSSRADADARLAARLSRLDETGPSADWTPDMAWLLAARGEYENAMELLDKALLAESPPLRTFARLHETLRALREVSCERSRITYHAPFFAAPPDIDGRLCEDWRSDHAAVLDATRHIEHLQPQAATEATFDTEHPGARRAGGKFWAGPNDLSATMYLGWDAKHLYVAVDVNDQAHTVHDPDAAEWKGDCLVVGVDPECDGGYRLHGLDNIFWLGLVAKQKRPEDEPPFGGEHSVKVKEDESGTIYELAIPWAEIGLHQPHAGARFGLNIMVIDDDGRQTLSAATWTPGLTQSKTRDLTGSGVAPALFGTVILEER